MILQELFLKDVNRPIETVIKADDREHIFTEVEEYVITKDIEKKIGDFFAAYNDYQGVNGVWISGFFGSGKSHLLKILSYVLENREHDGKKLGELFAEKIEENPMLKGDISKATKIPSTSILFNIDQRAQITSKKDVDAILKVFYKVFNDHLGYFGSQQHVADFERWLDEEGHYDAFKKGFEDHAGEHWFIGRRKYFAPKTKTAIGKALGEIHGDEPTKYTNIIDTLRKDAQISVEDFCEKVAAFLSTKPAKFRLNFFVDEVGQFIADNTKLMLNLQTIAETLATKCKGQAWVFVTAQEDLEAIVGDDSEITKDDFSKIQGRFKLRIPLTSSNVDEVIEKRLLAKNGAAQKKLIKNWKEQKANLNTILSFSESKGIKFRKIKDEKEYVNKFPFIPYQFDLFQQCIRELSKHNAFQGKHASVGERSMLGVFQDILKDIGDKDINALVSFDNMFEGVRSTIRGEIQKSISLAEKNITNELAIKILKALFLVKYYTNFATSPRNISVLMLDSTQVDLKKHDKAVQEALNLLENQTYIQRNGEVYEFLTDDEKDVENEIKNEKADPQAITQFFNEALFDSIIGDNRLRFQENKQDYEFTKKIDGATIGRDKELIIEILTPNSEKHGEENYYQSHSMGHNTMSLFVLPQSERLLQDVRLYIKTEKYYKQNISAGNKSSIQSILMEKQRKNIERKRDLTARLKQLLGEATVYMNGTKHDVGNTTDGKIKVINAFQNLIQLAYPRLNLLGSGLYQENNVKQIIRSKQDDLFGNDDKTMSEAEEEMYNLVVRRKKQSERTTITDLREQFTKKPYGWYNYAILSIAAKLYKRGKIEARQDANLLSDEDFLANLLNNRSYNNTLLEPQMDFDQKLVRKLKEVYQDMFDESCPVSEARDVANVFKEKAKLESRELFQLVGNKTQYPFLVNIEPIANLLDKLSNMDYGVLISKVGEFEDDLLNQKEQVLDPIKKFWNGDQKKIFDKINEFLTGDQSNFEYIEEQELALLKEVKEAEQPYQGDTMKKAKAAMDKLSKKVTAKIKIERTAALQQIEGAKQKIIARPNFGELSLTKQAQVLAPFERLANRTSEQRYISTLRQYSAQATDMLENGYNHIEQALSKSSEPTVQYIKQTNVKFTFSKSELETTADVEAYVEALKAEMLRHIKENRRIIV